MAIDFFDLTKLNSYKLIQDVKVHPLKVNRDPRGFLIETLKTNWVDIYNINLPFTQNYFSITESNVARDEDRWHVHPIKQIDRFVVAQGKIVVALYDWRKESSTAGLLNLFMMGELNNNVGYYNLLIPKNVLHCFLVVSKTSAMILNYPTTLYDQKEEGRVFFNQVEIEKGVNFSWKEIREYFNLSTLSS